MTQTRRWTSIAVTAGVLGALCCAALLPLATDAREETFEIPKGTWARRRAGDPIEILPSKIFLVLKVRDILVLRNLDDVPQMFGPTLIMPGQSFRLPFDVASEYQFACTAHVNGEMTIVVEAEPRSAWDRLRYRADRVVKAVAQLSRERAS